MGKFESTIDSTASLLVILFCLERGYPGSRLETIHLGASERGVTSHAGEQHELIHGITTK